MANVPVTPAPVKDKWNELKGKLKAKFPTLTDEDLKYDEAKKEEMLNKLRTKLGKTKEELDAFFSTL